MSSTSKAIYQPLSLLTSSLCGILAGVVFRQVWSRIGDNDTAPEPKDLSRDTRDVLIAAAIQGAIFGLVKAGVDRAGAHGYRAITREDPS